MPTLHYTWKDQPHQLQLTDLTRIGRLADNELCIPVDSLSRHHAVPRRDGPQFTLEDLGSQNGIVHQGQQVKWLQLEDGTHFRLGDIEFVFSLEVDGTPVSASAGADVEASAAESTVGSTGQPLKEATAAQLGRAREQILGEIGKAIVGQKEVLDQILVALFARGHCLLIGVPGLAKTLMVRVLADVVELGSKRIQFTPDLMPSDITGTNILEEDAANGSRSFRFHPGPLFTNLLLADEINRTPPKTQAALLEAMQEHKVTNSGVSYPLPEPFMVLATQTPIEQEGTYPLPEAQLDRFMFCVHLTYPSAQEEQRVLLETTRDAGLAIKKVLTAAQITDFQHLVRQVPVSQHVASYALQLIRATRPESDTAPDFVKRWVRWGAGTRAGQYLLLAAKAHVLLEDRFSVSCADVRAYALPVLRHRMFCNFTAASEGATADKIILKVLETVKEPAY